MFWRKIKDKEVISHRLYQELVSKLEEVEKQLQLTEADFSEVKEKLAKFERLVELDFSEVTVHAFTQIECDSSGKCVLAIRDNTTIVGVADYAGGYGPDHLGIAKQLEPYELLLGGNDFHILDDRVKFEGSSSNLGPLNMFVWPMIQLEVEKQILKLAGHT